MTYDDDSSEIISITNEMIGGFDKSTLGKQTLTVTYKEKTAQYEVTIIEKVKEEEKDDNDQKQDGKDEDKKDENPDEDKDKEEIKNETKDNVTKKDDKNEQTKDNTLANRIIPNTGIRITAYVILALIVVLAIIGIVERRKYKKL